MAIATRNLPVANKNAPIASRNTHVDTSNIIIEPVQVFGYKSIKISFEQ
jgi:hypothetical protein